MEATYFQLGNSDKNRFVNILKIFFGIACIAVGVYWAIYGTNVSERNISMWVTILFMVVFGFYEIWSGSGKATRYIEVGSTSVKLKKSIFLSSRHIEVSEIKKLDVSPLKICFHFEKGTKMILRFGTTYIETNEKIVDALIRFAKQNAIDLEFQPETI